MKRLIINIDRNLCNGCGNCVTGCEEGAIQIINEKAELVKEQYCDGMGACIGTCPTGALKLEERNAEPFNEFATRIHLKKINDIVIHQTAPDTFHGCPGTAARTINNSIENSTVTADKLPSKINSSELRQWPVQLHLVPVKADFFSNRELVIMSTCGPLASNDIHWRFLRGRGVVVACPKLDKTDNYVEKLAAIFSSNTITKVIVVRMTVPCCRGLWSMATTAMDKSKINIPIEEEIMDIDGSICS
ncbi:MAG: 4Fe-4S binding protein [Deltaproteobacteria bacterium]|nr:4Fe-4S binding protein [Deltaproteobacteria bacterium]